MTDLRLVYAEYENGQPPFAWMDGLEVAANDHHKVHRWLGIFASHKGRAAQGDYGRVVRHHSMMILDTSLGFQHASGARQRVVIALSNVGKNADWAATSAVLIEGKLTKAEILVDQRRLRAALERSWADTTQRFLHRFFRALTYLGRTTRQAFSKQ